MLRTNSKKAKENTIYYILANTSEEVKDRCIKGHAVYFEDLARELWKIFNAEVVENNAYYKAHKVSLFDLWKYWIYGGCALDVPCYSEDIHNIVGNILEETEEEKSRYSYEQSENLLALLTFREVEKVATA